MNEPTRTTQGEREREEKKKKDQRSMKVFFCKLAQQFTNDTDLSCSECVEMDYCGLQSHLTKSNHFTSIELLNRITE